ncbi:MAG: LytTR family DNA-binding domain-containing protein [Bacteroidota bacterium]
MYNKISCIITDDEPFARKGLRGYVEKIDFLDLKGTCADAFQLSELLQQQPVDLLFLDIKMPHITGVEFLRAIQNPPKVIFTTAYVQYALEGFELNVMDYLLKPIPFERFLKAAFKVKDYFTLAQKPDQKASYFFVRTNGRLEKIIIDSILFVEGMENYVAIYLEDKKIITHATIKSLLEKLPAKRFIQAHKSYLIAINRIDSVEGNMLNIKKYQVPVSKYLRKTVLEAIVK